MATAAESHDKRARQYGQQKARSSQAQREQSERGRDLKGKIPDVVDPERKERARHSLAAFYEYFPVRFKLPFHPDGLKVRDRLEEVVNVGGLVPLVMPRGFGKTAQCVAACIYGAFTGQRPFAVLTGANQSKAKKLMREVKTEIRTNRLLMEDWPEICFPVREVGSSANRCGGQHYDGVLTGIQWGTFEIVLPAIPGSTASNVIILAASIGSADLVGSTFTRPCDGIIVRPSIVFLDDVQTEAIASNPERVDKVMATIEGPVLGMAEPGKKMAAVALLTVREKGDVADRLTDRAVCPMWRGEKFKLLYAFPTDMKLWDDYALIRTDSYRRGAKGEDATEFYRERRAEMDAGAVVAWAERFEDDELSAVQFCMNLFYFKPGFFWNEGQGEPRIKAELNDQLTRDQILERTNNLDRGVVPLWANHLTVFIDVQGSLLYWLATAWADDFTGAVVDYGTWPDQQRGYFTLDEAPRPFARLFAEEVAAGRLPTMPGVEASIRLALERCVGELRRREWTREGGGAVQIDKILVDTGFKDDTVCEWARSTEHAAVILPSRGLGIGAKKKPLAKWFKKPGERYGFHWRLPLPSDRHKVRVLEIDVNFWKSFVAARLRQAVGDKGALSVYGKAGADHRMLADHWCAEYCTALTDEFSGQTVEEWDFRPGKPDNHNWDAVVGCAAAACLLGANLGGSGQTKQAPKQATNAADAARKRAEFQAARGF